MTVHCIKTDPLALGTLVMVYSAMAVGQAIFVYSAAWPTFTGAIEPGPVVFIELIIFEVLWVMMIWSHSYTMCNEPGYIPKDF